MKKKPSPKTKKSPPRYVKFNKNTYELLESPGVMVELDLEVDVLNKLDRLVSSGLYLSRGDAIRDILRQSIREKSKK